MGISSATSARSNRFFSTTVQCREFPPEGSPIRINARQETALWKSRSVPRGSEFRRGPGKNIRGVPPGQGHYAHKVEGTGIGLHLGQEVCGTSWGEDLGRERGRQGEGIYIDPATAGKFSLARTKRRTVEKHRRRIELIFPRPGNCPSPRTV